MTRPVRHALLLVVALGLLAVPAWSSAQPVMVLYDNFSKFDPAKWRGEEFQPGESSPLEETSRMIVNGKLQLFVLSWGSEANDTGFSGGGLTRVRHPNPNAVTALQADVAVVQATAQGCRDNPNQADARAQLQGIFFNDGSSSGVGDETGDVRARFQKRFDSTNGRQILLQVIRCNDPGCNGTTQLISPIVFNTPWAFGQVHTLRLVWDQASHRFTGFVMSGKTIVEFHDFTYDPNTLPDTLPPGFAEKVLRVQVNNVNCTEGATLGAIQALFDNVFVNATP
jgi:hypothetical protein